MKILIVLLTSFMCLYSSWAAEKKPIKKIANSIGSPNPSYYKGNIKYEFRQATLEDTASLLLLYKNMTSEDKKKLVLVPHEFRVKNLALAISNGHVFAAFKKNNQAVAMMHLYMLTEKECAEKLQQFNFTGSTVPALAEKYKVEDVKLNASRDRFGTCITQLKFDLIRKQVYLYLGSAYTHTASRNQRVMSRLTAFAFNKLRKEIIRSLVGKKSYQLTLLYGQVAENIKRNWILRAFSRFLQTCSLVQDDPFYLLQWAYKHMLPAFRVIDSELVQIESEIPAYGCILTSKVVLEND